MKILILQVFTDNIRDYADIIFKHNKKWCERESNLNIQFEHKTVGIDPNISVIDDILLHPSWHKIVQGVKIFENEKFDYLWILDADALLVGQRYQLDAHIKINRYKSVLVSRDWHPDFPEFNCGSMIFKNNIVAKMFINAILYHGLYINPYYQQNHGWEQNIFNHYAFYKENSDQRILKPFIADLEYGDINSGQKKEESLLVWHLVGIPNRVEILKQHGYV